MSTGASTPHTASQKPLRAVSSQVDNLSLDKYLPLGVLSSPVPHVSPYPDSEVWSELDEYEKDTKVLVHGNSFNPAAVYHLIRAKLIRVFHSQDRSRPDLACLRVYVLPEDVARRDVDRENKTTRANLNRLLSWPLDTSSVAWEGYEDGADLPRGSYERCGLRQVSASTDESLFYIFNTIASPTADTANLPDEWSQEAGEHVLHGQERQIGIQTSLYPYQRRSIVTMMQRELAPQASLDPRLEAHTGPTGQNYFFDRVTSHIYLSCAHYEEVRGGILAETMGYGKTLIVLGLIAATKDQMPRTPIEHVETRPFTNKLGARSLMSMAADCANKHGIPWRLYFRDMAARGIHYDTCKKMLETPPYYEMIAGPSIYARTTRQERPIARVILCKATLVVVPANLFDQWRAEIRKHLTTDAIDILEVNSDSPPLGTTHELAQFDLILMSKPRYADEMAGRYQAKSPDPSWYYTPLREMHFLRFVIDEGQTFASTGTSNANHNDVTCLKAERRWIVSGTPSHGLVGVEVDLAASEQEPNSAGLLASDSTKLHSEALERRRKQRAEDIKDLARLGRIVTDLLRAQPWSNTLVSGDAAPWSQYTRLGADVSKGFYSVSSVKSILQSLVVRHQIGDVEAELPPLYNKTVYLEPTMYDKMSMDLFTFVVMNNAITSERVDQDYLLHESNRKSLDNLAKNLRRAPFFWSSFTMSDISKGLEIAEKYAKDHSELVGADRIALNQALQIVPFILEDKIWQMISFSQEIALSIENLPQAISAPLGIDNHSIELVNTFENLSWHSEQISTTTAARLLLAQTFCRKNASSQDPLRGLAKIADEIANTSEHSDKVLSKAKDANKTNSQQLKGIPKLGDVQLGMKEFAKHSTVGKLAPSANKIKKRTISEINAAVQEPAILATDIRLSGTVSAKFSYLLSRVDELHRAEKILIFYEGDYIAWYVAQGLETLGVPHFIYANSLGPTKRNEYLTTFMEDDSAERVMLIDIKQGGQGLNITAASRVFFVNQVWNVGIEAQAIKRAHRIGQKKPVYVETLILKDSIEQKIFERRRQMTAVEKAQATGNPLDDDAVHDMFKTFNYYGGYDSMTDGDRYAPLTTKPLAFPELAAYQASDIAAAQCFDEDVGMTGVEETHAVVVSNDGNRNNNGEGSSSQQSPPASRPVKKAKKKVGFAV